VRANPTIRIAARRFTRPDSALSQETETRTQTIAIHTAQCNFVRIPWTLRCMPAISAGKATEPLGLSDLAVVSEDREAALFDGCVIGAIKGKFQHDRFAGRITDRYAPPRRREAGQCAGDRPLSRLRQGPTSPSILCRLTTTPPRRSTACWLFIPDPNHV
jgi:hypothetical protein